MPRKKYGRKKMGKGKKHRRAGHKNKFNKLSSQRVRGPGVVIPDRMFMKMSYLDVTHQTIGVVGSSFGGFSGSANNPFLNQPIGWTEISTLYRYYRVRAAKAVIRFVNMEAFPVNVLVTPQNATLTISLANGQIAMQNAFVKYAQLSPTTGMDRAIVKNYISTKKLVGTKAVDFDDSYAALVTMGPTNQWFWTVYTYPLLTTNTFTIGKGVQIEYKLTYYIEWYERNILSS